jgi:hypothetical protein
MRSGVTGTVSRLASDEKSGGRFPAVSCSILLLSCLVCNACGGGGSSTKLITVPPPPACGAAAHSAQRSLALEPAATPSTQGSIPATYFGFNLHPKLFQTGNNSIPWPTIPFGAVRLWATETTWNDLNPSNNVYDFSTLDTTISVAKQNGQNDFIYTFGVVPPWASSVPNDPTCVTNNSPAGSCDPPSDLNPDGSGADAHWQNFVTAITAHNAKLGFPIHTWEIWNEPNILIEWTGKPLQMARMAQDAYAIIKTADPTALVTTPTPGNDGTGQNIKSWELPYLEAVATLSPGNPLADIVTFHGYADAANGTPPESEASNVNDLASAIASSPFSARLSSLPLWNTEGSWNNDTGLPDLEAQAAYLARMYLIQWSLGVSRFYWYQYGNSQNGTLWNGTLDPAGVAYGQVYDWMVGSTLTTPCSKSGSVWTCTFTKNGIQEQTVWDASLTCSNGVCPTSSYTPGSNYTQCSDLAGTKNSITAGAPIGITAQPILLETQ